MAKTIRKAEPGDVVMCKQCSEAAEREVYFDRSLLRKEAGSAMPWGDSTAAGGVLKCPAGHVVEQAPAP